MKYVLTVETDNAAFEDAPAQEVARILESLAASLSRSDTLPALDEAYIVRDHNGNTVGKLKPSL